MTTDLDGTLSAPLQLEFCTTGITVGGSEEDNRSGRTDCSNSSTLFSHHLVTTLGSDSSTDNFVTGDLH